MKKFLLWCCGVICAMIVATVATTALISCDKTGPRILHKQSAVGVKEVSTILDSIVNPRLKTTEDVFKLQDKLIVNAYVDSVFTSMDQKTLENVSSVILKRLHYVTKDDIVGEFIKNRGIYDNLPKDNATPPDNKSAVQKTEEAPIAKIELVEEGKTTVTEAPPTRVEEKSANSYRDTTIDGKRALIQIH